MVKNGTEFGLLDLSSDVPLVEVSNGQKQYTIGPSSPELRCNPLVEASNGKQWY